jgi:DNA-binding response OmpR family regulator
VTAASTRLLVPSWPDHSAVILASAPFGTSLADTLRRAGIMSAIADHVYDALHRVRTQGPSLFVIDFDTPGSAEALRSAVDESLAVMLIALTRSGDTEATLRALADGAHACAYRSCSQAELLARVDALLRRPAPPNAGRVLRVGDLAIDPPARTVRRGRESIHLTAGQFDVLLVLAREQGLIVPYARLREVRHANRRTPGGLRTIVAELRRLTGAEIRSVSKLGYVLAKKR